MWRRIRSVTNTVILVFALLSVLECSAFAQGAASINGTVMDPSQAAVADSTITLVNTDTRQVRTSKASGQGFFVFPDIGPGNYKLNAEAPGFKSWQQSVIHLEVGQTLTVNPQMTLGATTQQVEVTEAPPMVDTSSSNISNVINSTQIEQLPLDGRNALQLVSLAPGVVPTGTQGQFGATQITFASSGGRDIDVNYNLDGGINIDPFYAIANEYPNPDALQEFAVTSRDYSARAGRGSTDVYAITRSGTNNFHGSFYEFIRNTKLDARPYFNGKRPNFHRNQFGASIGGPILKDRLFTFLSYQGTQQSGGPGLRIYTTVPLAQRTGDFSALLAGNNPIIIKDPVTGQPFPNNIVPQNRIAPQATAFYQKFLPAPNLSTDKFQFPDVGTLSQHQGIIRVDYQLRTSDRIFVRYFMNDIPQVGYGSGSGAALDVTWLSDLPTRLQNTTIGESHTFTPHLLNEFRYTYLRSAFGLIPRIKFSITDLGYGVNTGNAFSQYGLSPDSQLSVSGGFTAYPGAPTRDIMPTTHIADNVSWVKGNHNIGAGVEIYKNRVNENQNFFTGGALGFNGQFTGVGASDFLLSRFSGFTQIGGLSSRLHQVLPSAYVQDDIKVTPRLTVTAGVRWDIVTGYNSEQNQLISLTPGRQSTVFPLAPVGLLFPGDAGIPKNVVGTRWNNVAPRVGVAYDLSGNGRTSLRAGFGSFYVPTTRGITFNRLTLIQPFTLQVNISTGDAQNIFAAAPFNGVNPFPRPTGNNHADLAKIPFVPTAGESSLATNTKTEASYEWSLSLQQAVWKQGLVEADYVGSTSKHLTTSAESNPAVYIPGSTNGVPNSTTSNTQNRRLLPQIGSVNSILNVLNANYNSLQLGFQEQFSKALFVKTAYTWSKSLGIGGAQSEGSSGPRNPFNYGIDYGPLDFDVKHNSITSFIWQPQYGDTWNPVLRQVAAGWQVGGIYALHTGTPFTLHSNRDNSLTGIGGNTPDVVPGVSRSVVNQVPKTAGPYWFNGAAFKQNAIGTFGQVGHNSIYGPGFQNVDLNLQKNLKFYDRYGLEFRSSFYNAFNHINLGNPDGGLTSGNFGRIFNVTNPRVIEFGLRATY